MATYVNIMSKVSPETAERMDKAVQALGLRSKYELMQAALALILRYVDPSGEPQTPEGVARAEELRALWGDLNHLRASLSLIKPQGNRRPSPSHLVAIYGKELYMLTVQGADGGFTATTSMYEILDMILNATLSGEAKTNLIKLSGETRNECMGRMLIRLLRGDVRKLSEVEKMFQEFELDTAPRYGIEHKPARAKNKRKFE